MRIRARSALVPVLVLACLSSVAGADSTRRKKKRTPEAAPAPAPAPEPAPEPAPPPEPPADATPWGKGVSAERKDKAFALLEQGNALFVQNRFPEALAKYEEAIGQWDHPAIHFNIVRVLLALDRPLEAQASLEKALAYGAAPLETDHYAEALSYKGLIGGRVGTLNVSCKQAGVTVKLDGAQLLVCPGQVTKKLMPGNHAIVGTKLGHQTETKDVVIVGGAKLDVGLELVTTAQATVYRSRWSAWKPWALTISGVAIAGAGLGLRMLAVRDSDELDATFQNMCQPDCTRDRYVELGLADDETRIERNSKIAVGTMIGGGVIAVAGITAVILNRPRPYVKERRSQASAQLVPSLTPAGGGLAVVGRF